MVLVLIVLTLLAVVAVGYLSSMTSERVTANAYLAKGRAEQAAQAGVDVAVATLRQSFKAFPDSCTVWDTQQSATSQKDAAGHTIYNEGTSLYYRAQSASPSSADENRPPILTAGSANVDKRKIYVLPLTSGVIGAVGQLEANKADALPVLNTSERDVSKHNFVDLNSRRYPHDSEGWIGSPPGHSDVDANSSPAPKPIRVPWVETKGSDGAVNARYAFWVEDESFRSNVNLADLGDPSDIHKRRDNLKNPDASDRSGYIGPRDLDLAGLLKVVDERGAAVSANPDPTADEISNAQSFRDVRFTYPASLFPEALGYRHAVFVDPTLNSTANPRPSTIADRLRFLTTIHSGGLNISRHGSQRLNLNEAIPSDTAPTDATKVKTQLEKVIRTIEFHAPNFGQRFYRKKSDPTPAALNAFDVIGNNISTNESDHTLIYLYKTAANIRDYIDKDPLPTVVLAGGALAASTKPLMAFHSPPWACGKDSAPFIQECAVRYVGNVTGGRYSLSVDYYVEVWNMSSKDVRASDLGQTPFLRIANPPKFVGTLTSDYALNETDLKADDGLSPSDSRPRVLPARRDFDVDLSNVTYADGSVGELIFPAGQITLLTTDTVANHAARSYLDVIKDPEARKHVVQCHWAPPGKSNYAGLMPRALGNSGPYCNVIVMLFGATPNGGDHVDNTLGSDYETNIILGSEKGWIDGIEGDLPISWGGRISFNYTEPGNVPVIYGGYLRGNYTNTARASVEGFQQSTVGDPRAINEQLQYDPPDSYGPSEATRFKVYDVPEKTNPTPMHPYTGTVKGVIPTLGLPNYQSVHPSRSKNPWIDYPPLFAKDDDSVAAADLTLSKEKAPGVIANAPLSSIGQLGDVYDAARIVYSGGEVSSSHGGGRTFKIGQHDDRWDGDQRSASRTWASWRLLDFFSVVDHGAQPRLINACDIEQPGLININGVARDKGAALRAALIGLKFQKANAGLGDRALDGTYPAGSALPALNVDAMIAQIVQRIAQPPTKADGTVNTGEYQTGAGPFWERGELSELRIFGRTPTPSQSPGSAMSTSYPATELTDAAPKIDLSAQVFDRGREEIFRRLAEMITTRGNVFTVYAVGQAVSQKTATSTKYYSATQRMKVTFKLIPKSAPPSLTGSAKDFHPATDDNGKAIDFDPTAEDSLRKRFAKPDHYDIVVLSSTAGM